MDPLHTENLSLLSCEPTASYSTGFLHYPSPTSALQTSMIKLLYLLRLESADVGILLPSNCMDLLHQKPVITEEASYPLLWEKSFGGASALTFKTSRTHFQVVLIFM